MSLAIAGFVREDGDLHSETRVDVLPPGMQEVSD